MKLWRGKKGLLGQDIEGIDHEAEDKGPSDEWFALDRDIEEKLEREVQEELEPFGRVIPQEDVEMGGMAEAAEGGALPPSPESAAGDAGASMPSPTSSSAG